MSQAERLIKPEPDGRGEMTREVPEIPGAEKMVGKVVEKLAEKPAEV